MWELGIIRVMWEEERAINRRLRLDTLHYTLLLLKLSVPTY